MVFGLRFPLKLGVVLVYLNCQTLGKRGENIRVAWILHDGLKEKFLTPLKDVLCLFSLSCKCVVCVRATEYTSWTKSLIFVLKILKKWERKYLFCIFFSILDSFPNHNTSIFFVCHRSQLFSNNHSKTGLSSSPRALFHLRDSSFLGSFL